MKTVKISKADSGIRLDKFLFKIMPDAPSGVIYKSLRKKRIKVNGKRTTDGTVQLDGGDVLELYINDEFFEKGADNDDKWLGCDGNISVVYTDENIVVMNKPSGMKSQDSGDDADSLESEFRAYLYKRGELDLNGTYLPSLCHRIDRNTSGLVIGAKNLKAHRIITEKIKTREIKKFYICRAEGRVTPESGKLEGYILKCGNDRVKFSENRIDGAKPSALKYRVIQYEGNASVLEVELLSGRTHQIRATLAHYGHPLVGDKKYGAKSDGGGKYQSLSAYKLVFGFKSQSGGLEYLTGKEISIEANV